MWIVVRDWGHEVAIDEFDNEKDARDYYLFLEGETEATMYIAEVKKKKEGNY